MQTQILFADSEETRRLDEVFGRDGDSMEQIDARAHALFPDRSLVVWEGDAATFQFRFVGPSAASLLGYPTERWTREPTFWADVVVHPEDRNDAIAFCALATAQCRDHDFVYRAVARDGRVVWLHDVVRVILSERGIPERLRGIMIDVSAVVPGA